MKISGLTEAQQKRIERSIKEVPFGSLLGIRLDSVEPGIATMSLPVRDELRQNNRVVHGGALAALVDSAAAFAVIPLLKDDETTTTVDLTISYLRPIVTGEAKATARVLRAGSRIINISAEIVDHEGTLAATALTTFIRLQKFS
jgi:acyl-CoA thioesterase